ncbi:MAG: SIMPL domain-containing protein [Gammaproteobacteria bacterium]|nr:SIMPL domain-containing protein [Gammaproteobacteria bacterium]
MPRKLLRLIFAAVMVSQLSPQFALAEVKGIHVTGRGVLHVQPDMARLTFQVTREGQDATALKNDLDKVTRDVLTLTRSLGIAGEDVTAAAVNIQPRYRRGNGSSIVDGVRASRTIAVVLRDLEHYGELMNGALKLGVNTIGGTQLDTSEREMLEKQALELAMVNAREEARRVAVGFGVRAGTLLDVHVGTQFARPQLAMRAMESSAGADFSAGQIIVQRDLQATFAIESP